MNIYFGYGNELKNTFTNYELTENETNSQSPFRNYQINTLNSFKLNVKVKKISCSKNSILLLTTKGKVFQITKDSTTQLTIFKKKINDIASGYGHHLASSDSYIYSWFDETQPQDYKQLLRLSGYQPTTPTKTTTSHYFDYGKIFVYAGKYNSFIYQSGSFFGNGLNDKHQRGFSLKTLETYQNDHHYISSNGKIFVTNQSDCFATVGYYQKYFYIWGDIPFETTLLETDHLYSQFYIKGQLVNDIEHFCSLKNNLIIYTKTKKFYFFVSPTDKIKQLDITMYFQEVKTLIEQLPITNLFNLNQELLIFTNNKGTYKINLKKKYGSDLNKKIKPQNINTLKDMKCKQIISYDNSGFIIHYVDPIALELFDLFKQKLFTDVNLKNFRIHQNFFTFRLRCPVDILEERIKDFTKEDLQNLILWVYTSLIRDNQKIKEISEKLKINDLLDYDLTKDLRTLAISNSTQDYTLVVNEKKIKVHKFILQARSKLFREMFTIIDENDNCVHDYSGKSITAIKIMIYYLYTNELLVKEFNLEKNLELLFEELEDVVDYYQLNANCDFDSQVQNMKILLKNKMLLQKKDFKKNKIQKKKRKKN
ncbi:btk-binding protein-related [Anaeramoeba flamelloides]|uniref:Btk-binding protein-related n=1 Tax=Anaeramoeba flamelloides TaxID=1746091 RepID=A0AAV7YAJ4_9EUKA|nr:btk-binding protein-related [Anaeramoeba flamelloides]